MTSVALKVYKDNPNAILPTYGSYDAACFDLSACLKGVEDVTIYDRKNNKVKILVDNTEEDVYKVTLSPGNRMLVPTGIIFDLPRYFSLRIHPRSGLSIKHGVTLVNCEGVIDPDYVDPSFITLFNVSEVPFVVEHGMRLAQGELVEMNNRVSLCVETLIRPVVAGNRKGGFGSTGV